METVAPLTEIIEAVTEAGGSAFRHCYTCGKCDVVCPWNRVADFSIRRIIRQASLGLLEIELDDIWRCTTCGTCVAACPRGVEQVEVGVAVRRIAATYGVYSGAAETLSAVTASLVGDGNPLGEARENRTAWADGLSVKPYAEGMEILYFVGCYYSYDPRNMKVAAATAGILDRAGVDFGILGDRENCCGESIRKTGHEGAFKKLARENIKAFIDNGVRRILVSSPHCYHTFKNEYSEFMMNLEVVHITQYLQELIEQGRLAPAGRVERKVAYHDPCYLGRHNGCFDPPREVLKMLPGLELVELPGSRQNSLCCGGGGGRIWMHTDKEERFGNLRLDQALAVGAEVLVTSCPYCISNFEESRLSLLVDETLPDEDALQIMDLTEVVLESLNGSTDSP
ncbi:MAG: (Fe-S)-binding protein [bacterium]|nr:(Fe-S)-binding protein [bacterium]